MLVGKGWNNNNMLNDFFLKSQWRDFLNFWGSMWVNFISRVWLLSLFSYKRVSVVIFLRFGGEVYWPPRMTLPSALVRQGSHGSAMTPGSFPDTPRLWSTCFPLGSLAARSRVAPVTDLVRKVGCCLGRQIQRNWTHRDFYVLSSWLTNMNHQRRFKCIRDKNKQRLTLSFWLKEFTWKYYLVIGKLFLEQCIYPRYSSRSIVTYGKNKIWNFSSRNF